MSQEPILTVTELTARIKQTLEQGFAHIEVQGEVSRLTKASSGHLYFTIKDSHASLAAVVWRTSAIRLKQLPQEGKTFVFKGHISLYEPRGTYQMIVTHMASVGMGALAIEFEKRKKIFEQRGWFSQECKKTIPSLPKHIGIVTSSTAAAWEDVKKVLQSRPAWLQLILSPCLVQGSQAAASIADAIERFQHLNHQPDVILLVRGGGSMEDLWCFNDEVVVQALVQSNIPIISGIGHEIDTTLADFAADIRAATPSNAAEICCPSKQTLQQHLPSKQRLYQALSTQIQQQIQQYKYKKQSLRHIQQTRMDNYLQQQEQSNQYLYQYLHTSLYRKQAMIAQKKQQLFPMEPGRKLREKQNHLHQLQDRLAKSYTQMIFPKHENMNLYKVKLQQQWHQTSATLRANLQLCMGKLDTIDPKHVLHRGYTLSTDTKGRLLSSANSVQQGETIHVHFHDGHVKSHVQSVHLEAPHSKDIS